MGFAPMLFTLTFPLGPSCRTTLQSFMRGLISIVSRCLQPYLNPPKLSPLLQALNNV